MQNKIMLYIKVFLEFIFYLLGTFLHESAHWVGAILTLSYVPRKALIEEEDENGNKYKKEVAGFTIIPKIKKNHIVYGHVLSSPRIKAAFVIISIAPLVWLVALYYMLYTSGLLYFSVEDGNIYFALDYKSLFSSENLLIIYLSLQLIWAGTLSSQDIKMFFVGVFSISFLVIASVGLGIYLVFLDNGDVINFIKEVIYYVY